MWVVFWLCFLFTAVISAQEPYALRMEKGNGLPANAVYDLYQDSRGYVWVAGDEGLSRYDGFEHRLYRNIKQTSRSGSCIQEDVYGRIWYENFDGNLYYVLNDSLYAFERLGGAWNYYPYGLSKDYLYVQGRGGIWVHRLRDLGLERFIDLGCLAGDCLEYGLGLGGDFYLAVGNGLCRIRGGDLGLERVEGVFDVSEPTQYLYKETDTSFYVLSKFHERGRLLRFNRNMDLLSVVYLAGSYTIQGSVYLDDKYWIYTSKGVYLYDTKGKLLHHWFGGRSISQIRRDRQNNYWFGTTNEGIFLVPQLDDYLYKFLPHRLNRIIGLGKDWLLATRNGVLLRLLDGRMDRAEVLYENPDGFEIYYIFNDKEKGLVFQVSNAMYQHREEDFSAKPLTRYMALKSMAVLDHKYYVFASNLFFGLFYRDSLSLKPSVWDSIFEARRSNIKGFRASTFIEGTRVRASAVDSLGQRVFMGGNVGLRGFSAGGQTWELRPEGLPFYATKLFYYDTILYALHMDGDLWALNPSSGCGSVINADLALPTKGIRLAKQQDSLLLLVSSHSVYGFNLEKQVCRRFPIYLQAPYEIRDVQLSDSSLILLTDLGLIEKKLYNRMALPAAASPIFRIEKISSRLGGPRPLDQALELDPEDNDLSIDFALLDFSPMPPPLAYRINGQDWVNLPENSRQLRLPALGAGVYHIEFMMQDVVLPTMVKFIIKLPFWQRPWFFALIVLLLLALIALYYVPRIQFLAEKLRLSEEKIQLEKALNASVLHSIKAQMNPHFLYNALNTIQAYIFLNEGPKAANYLNKFSQLTRRVLDQSQAETISLEAEIKTLRLYLDLEQMRFEDDFSYHIDLDPQLDLDLVQLPPMLLQPYVENALKHGLLHRQGPKRLDIRFVLASPFLQIYIEDNGIGRVASAQINKNRKNHQAFSTQANEQRLALLNKQFGYHMEVVFEDLYDPKTQEAKGTRVILHLPLQ